MEKPKIIGEVVDNLRGARCVVLSLREGATIERGVTLEFDKEGGAMGNIGYHNSTHHITSIEIDGVQQLEPIGREDGLCSVCIGGLSEDLPPRGCVVMVLNDRKPAA
jgi:hypothetical protein